MATYIQIGSTVTVGAGGASTIDFTSIPSTYTDLVLVASTRDNGTTANDSTFAITLNGSTTYTSSRNVSGNGASAGSGTGDILVGGGDTNGNTSSTFTNVQIYIPNYTGTTQKSISADAVSEQNGTTAYMALTAQLFNLTSAITSISIASRAGRNWVQYTTASLYGISKS